MDDVRAQILSDLRALIAEHGWAIRQVMASPEADGDVQFAYTVGLTAFGHPEVVVMGMPPEHSATFLNLIGDEVRQGGVFGHGTVTTEFTSDDAPVVFLTAEDTDRLTAVEQVSGTVDALQMVWPDSTGRLPWDPGYRNGPDVQPILTRRSPN